MTSAAIAFYLLGRVFLLSAAAVVTIFGVGYLNRVTGGGWTSGPDDGSGRWLGSELLGLRGKPVLYTAPLLGLLAWCWLPAPLAAALALAFLIWRFPPIGQWLDMGRVKVWRPDRNWFETAIRSISFGSKRLAMFWRMMAIVPGLIPLCFLTGQWFLLAIGPPTLWLAFETGWQLYPDEGHTAAEFLSGWLWGLLIVSLAFSIPTYTTGGGF